MNFRNLFEEQLLADANRAAVEAGAIYIDADADDCKSAIWLTKQRIVEQLVESVRPWPEELR